MKRKTHFWIILPVNASSGFCCCFFFFLCEVAAVFITGSGVKGLVSSLEFPKCIGLAEWVTGQWLSFVQQWEHSAGSNNYQLQFSSRQKKKTAHLSERKVKSCL